MTDTVNMSLDEIIKQSRVSRTRSRGGGNIRGRGGGRGNGGRRGRLARGRGGGRGRSISRGGSNNRQGRSRSRSRGPGDNSQTRDRSQSQPRSRSRQRRFSNPRARSGSRSQRRSMTPKSRAGLENPISNMPPLIRSNRGKRGGLQSRLRRSNSFQQLEGGVHSRLGINTRRGGGANNTFKPLAVAKRGISKRGRGLTTRNRYSSVGLRSDQILKEQRQNVMQNNIIKSQTFTRSRNNSFNSASQLTVSVANDFSRRRRNSVGNAGYLNKQTLAKLNNEIGGYNSRKGPGSVKSIGSNRSNRSNRSSRSNQSNRSNRSNSSKRSNPRGRGRGRGGNRGVGRNFVNKQILNPKLQKEIAAIQGKTYGSSTNVESPSGVNFSPTPAATQQTLHQRFGSS